jgi:hypothetical protein
MIYIAHRGLTTGPNKDIENWPKQIEKAISEGFHCEIDLWVMDDKKTLMLGHDKPQYLIDYTFLYDKPLWIHAKNFEALSWLSERILNYFWHDNDSYTLTSNGCIWTYPGSKLNENSICNQPEWNTPIEKLLNFKENCFGVCSKYVGLMR